MGPRNPQDTVPGLPEGFLRFLGYSSKPEELRWEVQ